MKIDAYCQPKDNMPGEHYESRAERYKRTGAGHLLANIHALHDCKFTDKRTMAERIKDSDDFFDSLTKP